MQPATRRCRRVAHPLYTASLATALLQDTDDEQDHKQIEAVPFPPGEQPEDADELQAGAAARSILPPRLSQLCEAAPASSASQMKPPFPCLCALQALILQDLKTADSSQPGGHARREVRRGSVVVVRGADEGGEEATWVALVNKASADWGGGAVGGGRACRRGWLQPRAGGGPPAHAAPARPRSPPAAGAPPPPPPPPAAL